MKVHPAILQGVAHIAEDGVLLRGDSRIGGGLGQLGLEAARQAVDQAFELFHLGDERVAALGQLVLDGFLDRIGARFGNVHTARSVPRLALDRDQALVQFAAIPPIRDQDMNLAENRGGDHARADRNRQAEFKYRPAGIPGASASRHVQEEQENRHQLSTRNNPSILTDKVN